MKTLLIVVLLVALLAGAFIARPSDGKKSFVHFLKKQGRTQVEADARAKVCDIENKYLWIEVKENGATSYVNVFNHWFSAGQAG